MPRKRGLGRGLDALIQPQETQKEEPSEGLAEVSVDAIQPNPHQPRLSIDNDELAELAASIREHGLIQPLIVTRSSSPAPDAAPFQLIAGERRWRAARLAGFEQVPVIVKEAVPQEMLELALVENVQRADLNPLEEAQAYRQLVDDFGLTQEQVAERVGKSRVAVTNTMRLLRAAPKIQAALLAGQVREGHARALLALETAEAQEAALATVIKQDLNVRQTEALVRRLSGERQTPPPPPPPAPQTQALESAFREALGTKVSLKRNPKGAGQVVIHFYSDEELQHIYDRIIGEND
jgi:ParB family transcriptional regulator, chromosome partitioning protein